MQDEILRIIADLFNVEVQDLDEDTSLEDDLKADSIDLMELVLTLEEEFDTEIDEEDLEGVETIGDILAKLENFADLNEEG